MENTEAYSGTEDDDPGIVVINDGDSSITFTSIRSTASVMLDVASIDGTFATSPTADKASFSIATTNSEGYELTISSSSNTDLSSETDALSTITSGNISSSTFNTSTYNNMWGYQPNYYNSSATSNYYPITTSAVRLDKTETADATAKEYTIGIGARATYEKPAGTYTNNSIILAYVANPTAYSITYAKNTTDTVTNMPYESTNNVQSGTVSATSITLSNTIPVRDGYDFKGWCSIQVADGASCTGTTYNPDGAGTNLTYGIDRTASNTATIYAMWEQSIWGYIQDLDTDTCKTVASTKEVAVIDRRDESDYTVRYINDACWMTQNLRITGTISSTNSNFSHATSFNASAGDLTSGNSYTQAHTHVPTADLADINGNKPMNTYTANQLGAWYNYCAASAGEVCSSTKANATRDICPKNWHLPSYNTAPGSVSGITSQKDTFSPIYGGYYDGGSLHYATAGGYWWSATAYDADNQYLLYYYNGSLHTSGYNAKYYGRYIRCVRTPDYTVTISTNNASGITINDKTYTNGQQVTLHSGIQYEVTGSYASGYEFSSWSISGGTLSSTSTDPTTLTVTGNAILTLTGKQLITFQTAKYSDCGSEMIDDRGTAVYRSVKYTTAEINGLCWMTRNLDLPGGTTLTSSDSNVASNYALPASSTTGFYANSAFVYNSGSTTCSLTSACYSYYSYPAATAGTNPSSGAASYDICPKGWRLPTEAEYNTLVSSYNTGAKLIGSPFYGVYSGYYYKDSFDDGGSHGYYLSSTAYKPSGGAYHLYFNSTSASTDSDGKSIGYPVRCVKEPPYMQDMTTAKLAALMPNTNDTTTLYDSRDGSDYTVAKLADGYYWMTQNLRLGKGNGEAITLTSTDSNVTSNFELKASGMGSNKPDATGDCNVGDWYPSDTATYLNVSHLCINTTDTAKYGVYYNWYAATAGTGTYSTSSGNTSSSICPKGWILPPNSGERSYYNLLTTKLGLSGSAGSATMQGTPYNFPLSGSTYGEGIDDVGTRGYFWSSSARTSGSAYSLYFYRSTSIYPQSPYDKGRGTPVRCVFGS